MASKGGSAHSATPAFLAEANMFKLGGVCAWHAALFLPTGAAWVAAGHGAAAAASPGWLASLVLVWAAGMLPVLLAQRRVLTTLDVPPLYIGRLGWGSKSWPSLLLSRCLLRQRTLASVRDALALYGACASSAALTMALLQPPGSKGARAVHGYGLVLALLFGIGHFIHAKNVLAFPLLQRHRYFRLKQRLPALAKSALALASLALLLSRAASGASWLLSGRWPSVGAAAAAWRAGCLLVWGWASGGALLEIVFTERLALLAGDSEAGGSAGGVPAGGGSAGGATGPLLEALAHPEPIVQDWCLLDLAAVATDGCGGAPVASARRAALFADETGACGWVPLSRYCLSELSDFVDALAAALPTLARSGGGGGGARQGVVRWNSLQLSAAGVQAASAAQDLAAWHLQARHTRLVAALRALSGLAAAGLSQDRYGLLSLCSPGLGDVLMGLLGVVAVLQAYIRHSSAIHSRPSSRLAQVLAGVSSGGLTGALRTALRSSINAGGRDASANGSPQQHVDAAAWALLDVAKTCTYRVTNTYGGVLASLVAARKPLVGTTADAQALLAGFLACEQ